MERGAGQFLALKIWLCNPVTLYAFYLFGRFESIPIFFFALTLRLAQKQRLLAAAVALGLTLNCQNKRIRSLLWNPNISWRKSRSISSGKGIKCGFH